MKLYINVDKNISTNYTYIYIDNVFKYLKIKDFKYLYSISSSNYEYSIPIVWIYAYTLKEVTKLCDFHLDNFYFGQSIFSGYVFVYSNYKYSKKWCWRFLSFFG